MPAGGNNGHTGHNAYEFIMQPAAPKRAFSLGTGKSLFIRLGIILSGVVVLLIIAGIVISALAPKGSTPGLTAIAERQQEIIRIAAAAADQTTGQDTTNFVTNVNVSITSSQQQITSYLASYGAKINPKVLALDQDAQTDTLLSNAASANNYDPAVAQNLTSQLQTYTTLLKTTYTEAGNKQTKELLQSCFSGADLLLKQARALSANS
jgi:hypothetical protein